MEHRRLKGTPFQWLDIMALCCAALPPDSDIVKIVYCTSEAFGRLDPEAPVRQSAYLAALQAHIPELEVKMGATRRRDKRGVLEKVLFKYEGDFLDFEGKLKLGKLAKRISGLVAVRGDISLPEEKGSDVNLAVNLVYDALLGDFDRIAVISNDSDLEEALRIAKNKCGKEVYLLSPMPPGTRIVQELAGNATHVRRIREPILKQCQLPNPVIDPKTGRSISKPKGW